MSEKTVIESIILIIGWYKSINRDFNDIDKLIHTRKQLSCFSVDLAMNVGQERKDFESVYYRRKVGFAKAVINNKDGNSVAIAESKALVEIDELYKQEKESEAEFNAGKLILNQVNEVLSSLNSHIAYLKDEKRTIRTRQET